MSEPLITEFLAGKSKEIRDLASNEAALVGFLTLMKGVDDLQGMNHRFYEAKRCLYQVTAATYSIEVLMEILSEFFCAPVKVPGKALPVNFRFDPTIKFLGGVRKNQALFLKKLKTGSFFGALWPWQQDENNIEILLGYHSTTMNASNYSSLETLSEKFLSRKRIESVSGVGGQIHGISLPSFLQMSEMEGATYTLKVSSGGRTGYLHVDDGNLIAARLNEQTGNEAAYRIISWDNTAIQIEPAEPGRVREIHDSLMQVMMESLKLKDESGEETPPTESDASLLSSSPLLLSDLPPIEQKIQEEDPKEDLVPPPPPQSEAVEPIEQPEDRSVGMQNRLSKMQKLLVLLGLVIFFAFVVTGGGQWLKKKEASLKYEQLQENLAGSEALDEKIVLLMKYLKDYPKEPHRSELKNRLIELNKTIETSDYEKTMADVDSLPIDERFENRALSLYTAFLTKYPKSVYADRVNEAIGGIDRLVGTAYFESLKKVSATDFLARYKAYRAYLEQFPKSEEREAVEQMIFDLANETAYGIEQQIKDCDKKQQWASCIVRCDEFLSAFDTPLATVQKVMRLRSALIDRKDLANLTANALLATDAPKKAHQMYKDYLIKRPETSKKEEILHRIERLEADLAQKETWLSTKGYATDAANDIVSRIQRLENYLHDPASSPYEVQARRLRTQLEPAFQKAISDRRAEENRRMVAARQKMQTETQNREIQRIQQIRDQVLSTLKPLGKRYAAHQNGTVTDQVTGLTWCLLDSYLVFNQCISYDTAKNYVQSLDTGGYSDWRLPTAGELATIYKNSPSYPVSGAPWYWSSESFARGFHRVVDVVTPNEESEFKRISKREDHLGAVRAVRRQ